MPNKTLALRQPTRPAGRQAWVSLAVLVTGLLATLAAGIFCLTTHMRAADLERVFAPAGIVLVASALVQSRLLLVGWRKRRLDSDQNPLRHFGLERRLLVGAFIAYLAVLAIGPLPSGVWAWLAAVAICHTALLLPLAVNPTVVEGWRKWSQHRGARRLNWLVYVSMILVLGAEAGLRAHSFAVRQGWTLGSASIAQNGAPNDGLSPAVAGSGMQIDEFRSQPFRVAILSDEALAPRGAYIQRVQEFLPGVELVPLSLIAETDMAAQSLATRLADCRPDLVLATWSPCAELTRPTEKSSWFDWRQFELARWVRGTEGDAARMPVPAVGGDFETYLDNLAPQLVACRTPIDETMHGRWQQAFAALDDLAAVCREQKLPMAVVVVPSPFQVNRALCDTLARRIGARPEQFDVELPQRRLADYAQRRDLPVLDLLPHLRLSQQSLYERNDTSWNPQGHALAAGAISQWLEGRYGSEPALTARLSRLP